MNGTTYLIHLSEKIAHAQHYIGWTRFLKARLNHHRNGTGSRFLAEAVRRNIRFEIARKWDDTDGNFERKLKNRKKAKMLCPICRKEKSQ
jgi:predicted GIY-YIG superfamily endonuclease